MKSAQATTDPGHMLVVHAAAIHIQIAELRHAGRDGFDQSPLILDGNMRQVHLVALQSEFLPVERKAAVDPDFRPLRAESGERIPWDRNALGIHASEFDAPERGHAARPVQPAAHPVRGRRTQIQAGEIDAAGFPVHRKVVIKIDIRPQRTECPVLLKRQAVLGERRFSQLGELRQELAEFLEACLGKAHLRLTPVDFRSRLRGGVGDRKRRQAAAAQQKQAEHQGQQNSDNLSSKRHGLASISNLSGFPRSGGPAAQ